MTSTTATGLDLKMTRLACTRPYGRVRQADVAARMGVTRGRISQIETAEVLKPSLVTRYLEALSQALTEQLTRG